MPPKKVKKSRKKPQLHLDEARRMAENELAHCVEKIQCLFDRVPNRIYLKRIEIRDISAETETALIVDANGTIEVETAEEVMMEFTL